MWLKSGPTCIQSQYAFFSLTFISSLSYYFLSESPSTVSLVTVFGLTGETVGRTDSEFSLVLTKFQPPLFEIRK